MALSPGLTYLLWKGEIHQPKELVLMAEHCANCGSDEGLAVQDGQALCGDCRAVCESCGASENVQTWTDGVTVHELCDHCRLDGGLDEIAIEEVVLR